MNYQYFWVTSQKEDINIYFGEYGSFITIEGDEFSEYNIEELGIRLGKFSKEDLISMLTQFVENGSEE